MRAERPGLEQAIIAMGENLGLEVAAGKVEHAGRSFHLRYQTDFGADAVKIDLDYLNRSPLLPIEAKAVRL
jgi:hypothetical protein